MCMKAYIIFNETAVTHSRELFINVYIYIFVYVMRRFTIKEKINYTIFCLIKWFD